MHVHDVHTREIDAPPAQVGALLDGVGGPDDRLWPSERWPMVPFSLDGPLAAGTRARHGSIRYSVDRYEPGRRVTFRFAPGLGLAGTHGWELEPLGRHRTRLSHTLEARVEPKLLALWPVIRGCHIALVEDALDQAERAATGHPVAPRPWPLWLRLANGAELRVANRRARRAAAGEQSGGNGRARRIEAATPGGEEVPALDRVARAAGVGVPAVLVAIAALHAAWAAGSSWPAAEERALAERIFSQDERFALDGALPPAPLTAAVALALLAAAGTVRAVGSGRPSRRLRGGAWAVAAAFLARGVVYLPSDVRGGGPQDSYQRWDLAVYSPLCLALGAGTALVTRRPIPVS